MELETKVKLEQNCTNRLYSALSGLPGSNSDEATKNAIAVTISVAFEAMTDIANAAFIAGREFERRNSRQLSDR